MSAQHTPGPWKHEHRKNADDDYYTDVFSDVHGLIAQCAWTKKPKVDGVTATYRAENARLIAAAPDLLDALRRMVEALTGVDQVSAVNEARAAIAKATGAAP